MRVLSQCFIEDMKVWLISWIILSEVFKHRFTFTRARSLSQLEWRDIFLERLRDTQLFTKGQVQYAAWNCQLKQNKATLITQLPLANKIQSSDVRLFMGTRNFFFVARSWQEGKHLCQCFSELKTDHLSYFIHTISDLFLLIIIKRLRSLIAWHFECMAWLSYLTIPPCRYHSQ